MKVIFLCGGVGKRMLPVTGDKSLLKFLGKTLLGHHIEKALSSGFDEFVLVGNRGNIDRLREVAASFPRAGFSLVVQEKPTGVAGAILSAREFLIGEIMVADPSNVCEESAYAAMNQARQKGTAAAYILGARAAHDFPGSYLAVNQQSQILSVVASSAKGKQPGDLVNIGVHYHRDAGALFRCLVAMRGYGADAYERALDRMIKQGYQLEMVEYEGFWQRLIYPWHILAAIEYFLEQSPAGIAASAVVSERTVVEEKVIVDDNVRIMENAVVRGPCYIGKNSVIGNNVLIRGGTHIGADCTVGFATEIKHSYVGDGGWFHSNYIGDSVISDGCSFGAGTVTANLRFDEGIVAVYNNGRPLATGMDKLGAIIGAGSRTGVNASIMPGVRVGAGSIVGPSVMLRRDLGPGMVAQTDGHNKVVRRRLTPDTRKRRRV